MKGLVGLLITAAIGLGIYMYTLRQAAPGPGMVVTQNISLVGVKNDLLAIAQAERNERIQRLIHLNERDAQVRRLGGIDDGGRIEPEDAREVGTGELPAFLGGMDSLLAPRQLRARADRFDRRHQAEGQLLGAACQFLGVLDGNE